MFKIEEEQKKLDTNPIIRFSIDLNDLINKAGKSYKLKDSLKFPEFRL